MSVFTRIVGYVIGKVLDKKNRVKFNDIIRETDILSLETAFILV